MECDFCSNKNVVRHYQCMDFKAESRDAGVLLLDPRSVRPTNLVLDSTNFWAACKECAAFVDAEDLDGLLRHAVKTLNKDGTPLSGSRLLFFVEHMRHAYEMFFKNRIRVAE